MRLKLILIGDPTLPTLLCRWFRQTVRPLYDAAVADVAKFVGADPNNLVFVQVAKKRVLVNICRFQNATTAVNTVVKNLSLGPEVVTKLKHNFIFFRISSSPTPTATMPAAML